MQEHDYSKPYNFDYKSWFEKDDLTHEQIAWCVLGVNPDAIEEAINSAINNEEGNLFLKQTHEALLEIVPFKKNTNVNSFVQGAYEHRFKIPLEIKKHLIKLGLLQLNNNLEQFKNYEQYKLNPKNLNLESINSEDAALAVLLGLNPEHFINFLKLDEQQFKEPRCKKGLAAYARFSPEEKWLYDEYRLFIEIMFEGFDHWFIIELVEKAKKLNIWNSNFSVYAQNLHNEGFIFKKEIYDVLHHLKITVQYEENGRATQFYKKYLKEGAWTLTEAVLLFKGEDPNNNFFFYDVSQNPHSIIFEEKEPKFWESFNKEFLPLETRLKRYRLIGKISYGTNEKTGEILYKPEEIIPWLLNNTDYIPPAALLQEIKNTYITGYTDVSVDLGKNQQLDDAYTNKKPPTLKEMMDKIYDYATIVWKEYYKKNKRFPTRTQTAEAIKKELGLRWARTSIEREIKVPILIDNYQKNSNNH